MSGVPAKKNPGFARVAKLQNGIVNARVKSELIVHI